MPRHRRLEVEGCIYHVITRGLERTICDYIAGMTDRYAIEEHRKLFDSGTLP